MNSEQLDGDIGDIGGIGAYIAFGVIGSAREGEVWVSRTVSDRPTGSGLAEGTYELKGIPGEWELVSSTSSG